MTENDGNNTVGLHKTDETVLDDINERRPMLIKLIGHPLKCNSGKTEEYQRKTSVSDSLKEFFDRWVLPHTKKIEKIT